MRKIVKYIGKDDWGRKVYSDIGTLERYKEVDGHLYTFSKDGEPDCPIRKDIEVIKVGKE